MHRFALSFIFTALLTACATSTLDYVGPAQTTKQNSTVVDRDRDAVWAEAVPRLGKQFFALNTIDKASGLINLSYSGDPERYVDCGRFRFRTRVPDERRTSRSLAHVIS